ncbi:hypothetical protein P1X15_23100 [Runella sp. MFBS21]|uniref:hypothetical protein n=1 Tax=Runella sp. MFBS21 TaxID=3034018 RepID=UPI0023F8DB46|nr:hypothetical protein [Runella sp. MFBS21]MDF7820530.1 hypothetical protein [Runella sp. MFBS21]
MPKRSISHLQKGSPHGATILLGCLILLLSSFSLHAQTSPSGQLQLLTPTTLSACNTDTIYLNLTNLQGAKGVTYAGTANIEISIPGGALLEYINNSVNSTPAGVQQQSYTNKKLIITVPLPATGATTRLKFVLRPDCNVGSISGLPRLTGSITYPTGFPLGSETFSSSAMNIGKSVIAHSLLNQTTNGNPTPTLSTAFSIATNILNTGYGFQNELIYTTINHKDLTFTSAAVRNSNGISANGTAVAVTPVSTTTVSNYVYRTYRLQGTQLGGDKQFTPNETIRVDETLTSQEPILPPKTV